MKKLNGKAINEIVKLLEEVKDVVRLLEEFNIDINSDCWSATDPVNHDYENILTWNRKNFETIDMTNIKSFTIGGNIITGSQHTYKNKLINAPKELAEIQGKIFKKYLQSIVNSISLKHFDLKIKNPHGLTDSCGWENYFIIEATVRKSALNNINEYNKKNQLQRIKENIEWRNKNMKEETYATHMAFDSIEDIINSKETKINSLILDNINEDEKFKIICRAKGIDIDEIALNIYKTIEESSYEDKKEYLTITSYQDEYMEEYPVHTLNIDSYMLDTKDDWIKAHMDTYKDLSYEEAEHLDWHLYVFGDEFNEEEKNFIKLALQCKVDRILLKWFP